MSDSVVLKVLGRTHEGTLSKTTLRAVSVSWQQQVDALLVHIQKTTQFCHNKSIGSSLDIFFDSLVYPLARGNLHPNPKSFLPRVPIHLKIIRW